MLRVTDFILKQWEATECFEQDGDMIHGVLEGSLWTQWEWISGVKGVCAISVVRLSASLKQNGGVGYSGKSKWIWEIARS